MGVFDLRCGISGLSTRPYTPGRDACSIVLLEDIGGLMVPVLLPVTGDYSGYGRVEATGAHAEWIDTILALWWDGGSLVSASPDGLDYERREHPSSAYLAHACDTIYNAFAMTLDGNRVVPCVFRDDVARAIAALPASDPSGEEARLAADRDGALVYADWLEQRGRPIHAMYVRRQHARADMLADPPAGTAEIADQFARVLRYVEPRAGLRSIHIDDADQHVNGDLDRFAQEAWDRGDPAVRGLLARWDDDARRVREAQLPFAETSTERAYAAVPVAVEHVAAVAGDARLAAAIEASPDRARVLDILRAPRAARPAVISECDGIVALDGAWLVVHPAEYDDFRVRLAGRTPRVADGATVRAGDVLTDGELDPHDVLKVLGDNAAIDRLVDMLRPLLDLDRDALVALVQPMFDHLLLDRAKLRATRGAFERWHAEHAARMYGIYATPILTSYATLATHADPTLDDVVAAVAVHDDPPRQHDYEMRLRR